MSRRGARRRCRRRRRGSPTRTSRAALWAVFVVQVDEILEEEELRHLVPNVRENECECSVRRYMGALVWTSQRWGMMYLARPERNEGAEGVTRLRLEFAHLSESNTHENGERVRGARLDLDLATRPTRTRRARSHPCTRSTPPPGESHVLVLERPRRDRT